MDPGFLLELVLGARDLADSARVEARERGDQRRVERVRDIIEALRRMYFAPRGVISLLNSLADGYLPTAEQIAMVLPDFNDFDFRMDRFMDRLDPPDGHRNGDLSLKAQRVLREISYSKSGLRRKVQDLLNEALTFGKPVPLRSARELRDAILQLNVAIEDAEEALMQALGNR